MAARTPKNNRKIEKNDTTHQARTALLASEEKEVKEGQIKAVARDEPTLKRAHTKLSAHCEEKNKETKKETHAGSSRGGAECAEARKKSKAPESLDREEEEEVELSIRKHTEALSIRKHTEAYGSSGAQHPSAYVGMREFADTEDEEAVSIAYLNQRGEGKAGREREWGGGSLSGGGGAGEARERTNKKEKHDGANVTNSTQLGGVGGVTLFQAALERVHSRDALETIRKLVCNCAEHPGPQFTCFTGTKVQILTQCAHLRGARRRRKVPEDAHREPDRACDASFGGRRGCATGAWLG